MAYNKSKYVEAAQKLLNQGKVAQAIGEYQNILKYEPRDQVTLMTIGELFERANLLRSEFGDAFVNRNRFSQETVAHEDLRKAFEIVDGLECLALADVQLAYGHQRDLVAGLVLQNILVFAYGLGDFALVQQLLCGLNVFALVISHARTGTNLPLGVRPDVLLNLRR